VDRAAVVPSREPKIDERPADAQLTQIPVTEALGQRRERDTGVVTAFPAAPRLVLAVFDQGLGPLGALLSPTELSLLLGQLLVARIDDAPRGVTRVLWCTGSCSALLRADLDAVRGRGSWS
jgi:hypothetical protein